MITETVGEDWADVLFLKEQRADELRPCCSWLLRHAASWTGRSSALSQPKSGEAGQYLTAEIGQLVEIVDE
jgi:hypothetical protein